ncbi:Ig-like domain-containing protein [Polluticaenibacter yanchengensis]|uniref:Ig-like domain-containing protein n=1 Tax=Polluticaenibacter yanchengensis TaxID=3014562 RepID=A0ABT4UK01_9BACT|nr:Ig-like domain-containing protein [Chitinophagaceae bacterium LY-5]
MKKDLQIITYRLFGMFALLLLSFFLNAQQSLLTPNSKTNWVTPTFSGFVATPSVTGGVVGQSSWNNTNNIFAPTGTATLILQTNRLSSNFCVTSTASSSAVGTIILDNNQTYNLGNRVTVLFTSSDVSNLSFAISTSSDGITYTAASAQVLNNPATNQYELVGFAAASFRYVRVITTLAVPGICTTWTRTLQFNNLTQTAYAAPTGVTCNVAVPILNTTFGATSSYNNVVDNDITNSTVLGGALGPLDLTVSDYTHIYSTGTYLGFHVSTGGLLSGLLDLSSLSRITITTYLNGVIQETKTSADLVLGATLLGGSNPSFDVGFVTTKPANEIKIATTWSLGLSTVNVYYPVYKCFAESLPLANCNVNTYLTIPTHPVNLNKSSTGLVGIGIGSSGIIGLDNIIDNDITNFASFGTSINLSSNVEISVKKSLLPFPAGYYAGFDIGKQGALNLDLLGGALNVATYRNGSLVESTAASASLLSLGTSILNGENGRRILGFRTQAEFDEIRLIIAQGIGASVLSDLRIYGAVVQCFSAGAPLACNAFTAMSVPARPLYIDGKNTGNSGLIDVAASTSNPQNVIDGNASTFASINMTAAIGTSTTFAVSDALNTYNSTANEKTYVAFDISTSANLANVDVLNSMSVRLIRPNGILSAALTPKLLAGVNLLAGERRQYLGVVAEGAFTGVQLEINNTVGASLGTLKIYDLYFQKLCSVAIPCNQSVLLTNGTYPVVINNERTGAGGLAGVTVLNSTIENAWNVIDANTANHATISTAVGVASTGTISVQNPVDTYPVGSFAGFVVEDLNSLLELDLFSNIRIRTFNDGVLQEDKGAGNLINLGLLGINLIGTGGTLFNVGFTTSKPFDEIQLVYSNIISLNLSNGLNVYGAFVDTRTAVGGNLFCLNTSPDFAITQVGKQVTGNLSTNDKVPSGTTYSGLVSVGTNPSNTLPTLASDGTYSFTPTVAGVYTFEVNVCLPGQTTGCRKERLTITVLNPDITTNPPVANDDVAYVRGSDATPAAATIHVKANDGAGNANGVLGNPTIPATGTGAPKHGTATVNSNGDIVYTPTAGFYGLDTIIYTICESPSGLCRTATLKIVVLAADASNSTLAVDDFVKAEAGKVLTVSAANGVKANDSDAEGNTQTVTAKTETVTGKGTLVLAEDGSYTFTPAAGYTGPVSFSYIVTDNGSPVATASATLHVLVENVSLTSSDFAVTYINKVANGNLATNDKVPAGTGYSNMVAVGTNPSNTLPVLSSDGTFSFSTTVAGVYTFENSVCLSGQTTGCLKERLTITVLNPDLITNPPVVNNDVVVLQGSSSPVSATINVKANDGVGNGHGVLGNPTVPAPGNPGAPLHGTATVNGSGQVLYTPNAGFYGIDTFSYTICETPTGLCKTAMVKVIVLAGDAVNSTLAADDYVTVETTKVLTVNAANGVLHNDSDAEGNIQTVTSKTETVTGKGTLVLASDGSYTFTPVNGYIGQVVFSYTITDNGNPAASASGTLNILVSDVIVSDLTPAIRLPLNSFAAVNSERRLTVEIQEVKSIATDISATEFSITVPVGYSIVFDPTQTNIAISGGANTAVENSNWQIISTALAGRRLNFKAKTGVKIAPLEKAVLGFTIKRTVSTGSGSTPVITVNIKDDVNKTYDGNSANNIFTRIINTL